MPATASLRTTSSSGPCRPGGWSLTTALQSQGWRHNAPVRPVLGLGMAPHNGTPSRLDTPPGGRETRSTAGLPAHTSLRPAAFQASQRRVGGALGAVRGQPRHWNKARTALPIHPLTRNRRGGWWPKGGRTRGMGDSPYERLSTPHSGDPEFSFQVSSKLKQLWAPQRARLSVHTRVWFHIATRKLLRYQARLRSGLQHILCYGSLAWCKRDFHAKAYV